MRVAYISTKNIKLTKGRALLLVSTLLLGLFTMVVISTKAAVAGGVTNFGMKVASGGATVPSEQWTKGSSPYFSWEAGEEYVGDIGGYCLYLGTSDSLSPQDSKGLLGTSGVVIGDSTCPFAYSGTNIDTATANYKGGTWLSTSLSPYYFKVLALDISGTPLSGDPAVFSFYFDNTLPNNPGYISLPGSFVSGSNVSFTWATSGGYAPSDEASGLVGIQYKVNSGTWYGDYHTGAADLSDVLTNDGIYTLHATYDVPLLNEGINTIYIRALDAAGNITTSYTTATLKVNTTAPGIPQNLAVTPSSNTTNAYSFSWQAPATYIGSSSNITYCYTVNVLPSAVSCQYTAPGVTSLSTSSYATRPSGNVMYIVARDEAGNINYDTYAEKNFSYNGSAPGMPEAVDVVDVSVKATSSWKLAATWESPTDTGAGVSSYKVYRSTTSTSCSSDLDDFTHIGTTPGESFVDTELEQQMYYYCVVACDSANSCSAPSSTAGRFPDGSYTEPAPLILTPTVSGVSTRSAIITWYTGRMADSRVAYGTKPGVYMPEEPASSIKSLDHRITLSGLQPATTYYMVTKWTDEDGNTGTSDELSFTTANPPSITNAKVLSFGLDYAAISFNATGASSVEVQYGSDTSVGNSRTVATSTVGGNYIIRLEGLESGTEYYYRLVPIDTDQFRYYSTLLSFATLPRPVVSDIEIEPVPDSPEISSMVSWSSNVEITSEVSYFEADQVESELVVAEEDYVLDHQIVLPALIADTRYLAVISGVDAYGNRVVSDQIQFTSATDTRAPKISDISISTQLRTLGKELGGTPQAQAIISWNTDEPATSQVEYAIGSIGAYTDKTQLNLDKRQNHMLVITGLLPASIYRFRITSGDLAGNMGTSNDVVVVTPKAASNVNELIFGNLIDIFSFL